jgi:hypothetical protein
VHDFETTVTAKVAMAAALPEICATFFFFVTSRLAFDRRLENNRRTLAGGPTAQDET